MEKRVERYLRSAWLRGLESPSPPKCSLNYSLERHECGGILENSPTWTREMEVVGLYCRRAKDDRKGNEKESSREREYDGQPGSSLPSLCLSRRLQDVYSSCLLISINLK